MSAFEIVNSFRIASPCTAPWDEMKGDDRARFCASCSKHVYNVSDLTADKTLKLLEANEGTACLRLYRRRDGTILTADCPVGLRYRLRRKLLRGLGAAVLLTVAVPSAVLAYAKGGRPGAFPPMPTGPGVTFADWSDWTLTVVGLRSRQLIVAGEGVCLPVMPAPVPASSVQGGQTPVNPAVTPQKPGDL
jgi:hypothetical protein